MMKRIIYITLAAVTLLLSACSERPIDPMPQVPGSTGSYIFFEPEVIESVETKTTMVEGTTLPVASGTAFGVYGYAGESVLFNNTKVTRSEENGLFSYDGLVGWLDATTTHNFYAYYPYDITTRVENNVPYIEYTQLTDRNQMIDILIATESRPKGGNPVVALEFHHRLWALDITVKNNREVRDTIYVPNDNPRKDGEYVDIGNDVKIKSILVEFDQIASSGKIYMNGNVSSEGTKSFSYSEVYSEPLTLTAGTLKTITGEDPFLFLPCASFNYRITLECISTFGTNYTIHHPEPVLDANKNVQWEWATAKGPSATGFEGGYRYTLDIVKSDFDVTFAWIAEGWEGKQVDHVFN